MFYMRPATVIIPTTGHKFAINAAQSVVKQTLPTTTYMIIDGHTAKGNLMDVQAASPFRMVDYGSSYYQCVIPQNVGANGFYGHRIYAAFTHLVNTDYVLYLDQDCWFEPNHVESCISTIEQHGLDWCYSLRRICDESGSYICDDNCESLGRVPTYHGLHHIDTNCYCIKTEVATKIASAWHGGWGQDRVFFQTLNQYFPKYGSTGRHTVNYRLAGNPGSVTKEFFENGNKIMNERYKGEFPWVSR